MQQPTRLISTPFAQEGEKTEIQNVTGEFDNSATYRLGFPPLTMQSIRLGGKPPKGTDFNGVLFDITENISFLCKGGRYQYNAGLSTLIGGYPEGSNLLLDDNVTEVVSTVAGNQNNPNTNMAGWILKPNKTTAVNVADASGETQQQVNYNGGAKWHSRVGGYQENERVVLTNGDIVKSTTNGNVNDPNVDMTGWVKTNDASFVIDGDKNQQEINSETKAEISKIYSEKLIYLTPEQFGAVGDGVADDTNAIQACINFLLTSAEQSRKYAIRGYGDYALSNYLLIVNFGFGADIYLRSIRAHASFPAPTAFNKGTPFFQVGKDAIGGSMVGLNIKCTYANGGGKATWIDVSGLGVGGSHFHADKLENVVNGVSGIKPNFHSASNKITGGYWVKGTGHGVVLEKDTHVVEGWIIDVNFICEFNAGGVLLRNAQYTNIRGQTDFNGRWLSELTTDTLMPSNRDKVFSNNGQTGVVIASYEHPKGVYKTLVYEGQDASVLGSKFAVGAATCNGWSGSVTAIRVSGTDNFFFDVIHDFRDQPFAKCIFEMPYCGGIVGAMQYTSQISAKRSTEAYGGANNGFSVAHDGTNLNMRDDYNNSQLLTASPTFIAPSRHLYMRDCRTFGVEVGLTLVQGVTTNVRTLTRQNNGTVTNVCEMYKVTCVSTDLGLNGEWDVFINTAGAISIKPIFESNVTASVGNGAFRLAQGALASTLCVVNFQRIF